MPKYKHKLMVRHLKICSEMSCLQKFSCLVSEMVRENTSTKPRIVKQGLIELSSAWSIMGQKCSILAEAQKVHISHLYNCIVSLFCVRNFLDFI